MNAPLLARLAADALLVLHFAIVLFIVLGLALFALGGALGWSWVRRRWLRLAHLAAIGVVIAQSWAGAVCPLTIWEMALRARAGDATYGGSFIAHWVGRILYWDAPAWVFTAAYSVFGLAVVAVWLLVPPRRSPPSR